MIQQIEMWWNYLGDGGVKIALALAVVFPFVFGYIGSLLSNRKPKIIYIDDLVDETKRKYREKLNKTSDAKFMKEMRRIERKTGGVANQTNTIMDSSGIYFVISIDCHRAIRYDSRDGQFASEVKEWTSDFPKALCDAEIK